jgi:hypothetical protein
MGFLDKLLGRKKSEPTEGMQPAPPPASPPPASPPPAETHEHPHGEGEEHSHEEGSGTTS